jgi:hypothetical protein
MKLIRRVLFSYVANVLLYCRIYREIFFCWLVINQNSVLNYIISLNYDSANENQKYFNSSINGRQQHTLAQKLITWILEYTDTLIVYVCCLM